MRTVVNYAIGISILGTGLLAWANMAAAATPTGISTESTTASSSAGVDAVGPSTPAEKRAAKLASEASGADTRAGRNAVAEKKLREAIEICLVQKCSVPFQARLHRDLGIVYIAGMKRVEDGKDEFTAALTADATVVLTPSAEDKPAVKQAFAEVKGAMASAQPAEVQSATDAETRSESEAKSDKAAHNSPQAASPGPKNSGATLDTAESPEAKATRSFLNWFSLGLEQDIVFHSNTINACSSGSRYECFDATGRQILVNDFVSGGNQVSGGFTTGTWRVLLGYDRAFAGRFSLGVRLGSVVAGAAQRAAGERAFMYFHGEGRAAVWLARDPFAVTGIHPYIFVSGGVAEADGKVQVQYTDTRPGVCPDCWLNAWKRSGDGFLGIGAGVRVPSLQERAITRSAIHAVFRPERSCNWSAIGLRCWLLRAINTS